MKYAFVLGRVYTLSIAELFAIFEKPEVGIDLSAGPIKVLEASPEVIVIESPKPINAEKLQRRLGGVIKILQVVDAVKKRDQDSINFALKHYFKPSVLKKQFFKEYKGKMQFGISIYLLDMDAQAFGEPKRLGMMIKKSVTDGGHSIRLVLPEFNSLALASVVVTKNLLLQKGAEICILAGREILYTAKTMAVQDFEDYGRRDYQRPVRDEKQGMIPPKVAQIMLNLSNAKPPETALDPFCGIGTILQEGLLLGFKMLGSDINKQAVHGAELNLEWFRNRYKIAPGKYHLHAVDATKVAPLLEGQNVTGVVTECTLGPLYGELPKPEVMKQNFKDLLKLYKESLEEFSKFLPKGGRVVMCIPAYRKNRQEYTKLESLDWVKDLGYNIMDIVPAAVAKKLKFLKLSDRNTAIYDRKDQIVAREIVIFEKI
jgi:tRNA G10  N-methylase Trm11